jgi:TRAP-type C4-dicarboxylate transport system permease small subunit
MPNIKTRDRGWLAALDRFIAHVTRWADEAAAVVCAFLIIATTFSVIVYQRGITIVWLDDVLRALLIWLVYLGSVSLCFHNDHITMDALYLRFPPRVRRALNFCIALLGFVLCAYVSKIGLSSMMREIEYGNLMPSGYLPIWPQSLAIPLCFGLMAIAYLSYLYSVVSGREHPKSGASEFPEGL